jgi:aminopeptidase I
MLSSQASLLSLRQHASAAAASASHPQPSTTIRAVIPDKPSGPSRNFILADMDGRNPRDNHICAACVSKLAPSETAQTCGLVTDDERCRLCGIAECKPEAFVKPFTDFLEENPTIFHTVEYFKKKLEHVGFTEVRVSTFSH